MKKVVIFLGAPSSGKGTQADLLLKKFGFYHFDTGKYGEQILHDPEKLKNKINRHERKNFDAGLLFTPSWTLKLVSEKTKELARAGLKIVFSGSPRTLYEAFGDKKVPGLFSVLEKEYGKKNIAILFIKTNPDTSIFRNINRLVCSVCATPVMYQKGIKIKNCLLCGGHLKKRIFDNPEKMKVRLNEYTTRTEPIFAQLKKRGYNMKTINGEKLPFEMFEEVKKKIN